MKNDEKNPGDIDQDKTQQMKELAAFIAHEARDPMALIETCSG